MKRIFATLVVAISIVTACKKDKTPPSAPTVTTSPLTNVTTTNATAGGVITSNGGSTISKSGIVWSKTNTTPTTSDSVVSSTATSGSFTVNLTNLDFGNTYYVRAFATNIIGTSYGDPVTLNTVNDTSKVRFTYMGQQVIYGVITSSTTGRRWMDRNLGSSALATSSTDTAGYGDLFNWGRGADGHQLRISGKTATLSSSDNPGHSNFIYNNGSVVATGDWRDPQNDNLWQGSNGINNPCPAGWHVPTKDEWGAETSNTTVGGTATSGGIIDDNSAFTLLKLTKAGRRSQNSGNVVAATVGVDGCYWSSTISTSDVQYMFFEGGFVTAFNTGNRSVGQSVRCIKD